MKILVLADCEAGRYYNYYQPGSLDEFDLIISCGDLKAKYLEFIVTMAKCPLIYVHGNHDDAYDVQPPEGCICIEDTIFEYKGIRFMGLGGSYRYKVDGKHMYNESQMKWRIRKMFFKLKKHKGLDVLVTHAPAKGKGDLEDLAHRGFECFNELLGKYAPKYMVHGHVHMNYGSHIKRELQSGDTTIINAYNYCVIEIADE